MSAERLYYEDSFLERFTARVSELRPAPGEGAPGWQVALDRTAFYPTSGGQPFDTGRLHGAAVVPVEQVEEDDAGEVWHSVSEPLNPGTAVEGEIDWDRRLDHMQQHTGQHLLSAVCFAELGAPTVSFHLGDSSATIDLAADFSAAPRDWERVAERVNRIIFEDRPVRAHVVTRAEAEVMLQAGELRKLPDRAGAIRLIEIADCDRNACGGIHVRSSGQIGGLWLRGVEPIRRGLRVGFVCGLRAVRAGHADAAVLRQAAASLSVGAADLPAAIARVQAESKALAKDRERWREALAEVEASRFAASKPPSEGLRLIEGACADRDADFVRRLAALTAAAAPATVAILSSAAAPACRVVLARSRDLNFNCGTLMREALATRGQRGGGSPDLAHGEVPDDAAAAFRADLAARVRTALVG